MIPIIYEDKHIIIVNKPVGMPSQKDRSRDLDVLTSVGTYLNDQCEVALISRLDRPVGGLMILTKHKEATKKFSAMQQNKTGISKYYLALVHGDIKVLADSLTDYMTKNNHSVAEVWQGDTPSCIHDKRYKLAQLSYEVVKSYNIDGNVYTLLSVLLGTGRFHQIRAQLAANDMPLYGDTKYNKHFVGIKGWHQIALCAYKLDLEHPYVHQKMSFEISPDYFPMDLEINK